ncbi:cation:proton antiporter [Leifsonia poae]|uniref:Sodium/hydrogen exchanger n=1 Tax=Leifsonia poae TaxID=110933 RepID=A0A9W6HCZ9_9MICO|nr:cation:proton antiporter [Leifsonia poae]GLJ77853.1 sodium/hydrogen exchanger [Leifsonia poae]
MDPTVGTIILLPLIAVGASLLANAVGKVAKIPLVVFEILLGLLVGPSVLGWIPKSDGVDFLANFGLAFLFFMAGNEIDFASIKGRPLGRASIGWLVSLVLGVVLGIVLAPDPIAGVYIGIALTSTALGTLMPVLRDAGELKTPFGLAVTAVGAIGEFGPLVAISLFLSGRRPLAAALVLIGFAIVAGLGIWLASRGTHERFHRLVRATLHTSGQFAVRFVVLVIAALVGLSVALGLDMLLGAFAAGVICRVLLQGASKPDAELVEGKLEAVAFGVVVPIFFINTGIGFDLPALLGDPHALLLLPIFVVLLLIVRGIPGSFAAPRGATFADRSALTLFSATGLPIIVAVTNIALDEHALSKGTATALVGAGMLSVLLFPIIALTLRKRSSDGGLRSPDTDRVPIVG